MIKTLFRMQPVNIQLLKKYTNSLIVTVTQYCHV